MAMATRWRGNRRCCAIGRAGGDGVSEGDWVGRGEHSESGGVGEELLGLAVILQRAQPAGDATAPVVEVDLAAHACHHPSRSVVITQTLPGPRPWSINRV